MGAHEELQTCSSLHDKPSDRLNVIYEQLHRVSFSLGDTPKSVYLISWQKQTAHYILVFIQNLRADFLTSEI